LILFGRPLVARLSDWIEKRKRVSQTALALLLVTILASSLVTETIGIHAIFGAVAIGALIPPRSFLARDVAGKLEDFIIVFLLPVFFASTGLRTQIGLLDTQRGWLLCGLIIFVASVGKFGVTQNPKMRQPVS
jgi:Kef-type K+ transport system membrane component KefB